MTQTSDRLERVARALCSAEKIDPDSPSEVTNRQGQGGPKWRDYEDKARVFIAGFDAALTDTVIDGGTF